jgi:hypothetical protein
MENKEIDVGIYKVKLTVYRTGNVRMTFVNRVNGEERKLKVKNPLIPHREVNVVNYRV